MRGAFDDVRVKRALAKEASVVDRPRVSFEQANERVADANPFRLGVRDLRQLGEKLFLGFDMKQLDVHVAREYFNDFFGLTGPEQSVIDEDAGELVADCAMDKGSRFGREAEEADARVVAEVEAKILAGGLGVPDEE